jgi:hypothetical protein
MRLPALRTALFALSTLLICPSLFSQSFTFSAPKTIPLASALVSKQIGTLDLSGDGKTDLAVSLHTGFYVISGDGKGNFSSPPIRVQLNDIHAPMPFWYDVNGDGKADAVAAYGGNPYGGYSGVFEVWLGDGKGDLKKTFSSPLMQGLASNMTAGDFNKDGKIDFAMFMDDAYSIHDPQRIFVFLNAGGGNFRLSQVLPLLGFSHAQMITGDFNDDGKLDLAWLDDQPGGPTKNTFHIHYRYGNGNGSFEVLDNATELDGFPPTALAAADLNHDGKIDLIVGLAPKVAANGSTAPGALPSIAILLGGPGGVFHQSASVSLPSIPINLSLHDMNGDGLEDLVVNTYGTTAPIATYILAGQPGGKFGAPQLVSGPAGRAVVAPVVKGGLPDIFYPNKAGTGIELLINTSKK